MRASRAAAAALLGAATLITAYDGSATPDGIGLHEHLRGLGPASPALP